MADCIDCLCDDPLAITVDRAYVFECDCPLDDWLAQLIEATHGTDIPEFTDHDIELETGQIGTLRKEDGVYTVCFPEGDVVIAPDSCFVLTINEASDCPEISEPEQVVVTHEYEYNFKRVDPCEENSS